ncbi:MAG TPA: hypothetical protein VFE72_08545, partial [Lysobacter sp.]|nr:hypothetical protein [Lysobacter sp.]
EMTSSVAFVRQLGAESGVQLNPLRDGSAIPAGGNADQSFGIIMRATRGRIDKPFLVDRGNVTRKLGRGEPVRVNALNEANVHVVEALNNGAYQAVVQRLVGDGAAISWVTVTATEENTYAYAVSQTAPVGEFLFAVQHLECFNDGIVLEFRAEERKVGGVPATNDMLTLRIRDSGGVLLYEFAGSLNPSARDDFGGSAYLPDVVASQTDAVQLVVGVVGEAAVIRPTSIAYGYDANGRQKWAVSGTQVAFTEGALDFDTADYVAAREKLQGSQFEFAYLSSGGSQAPALLAQLAQLAHDTNRQFRFDVPGTLGPEAAIAFVEQLNLSSAASAHLLHAYWAPLKTDDPSGVNPKGYFGTSTLNIAFACARNAQRNAKGFAPKNYPIAGREFPVNRMGVSQTYALRDQELNALARAKINPVVYETYTGGGRYVFRDSLTLAPVDNSLKKLVSVVEMSTSIDEAVTRAAKDSLQLPMAIATKRTADFLTSLFEAAEASGWLVPSDAPEMGGRAWAFDVKPNEVRSADALDVSYWLRYDGTNRQTFVTQTITR